MKWRGGINSVLIVCAFIATVLLSACSVADGDTIELKPSSSVSAKSSSSRKFSSSSVVLDSSAWGDSLGRADSLVKLIRIPATKLTHNSVELSVDTFEISATEVTQDLYGRLMVDVPKMDEVGDSIAVANVNWYDAVLFCNALSKKMKLDTAYVYDAVGFERELKNLFIDYEANAIRLPTSTEWEVAARAGSTTMYYWGNDVASKYAYYIQSKGPAAVAKHLPNAYGLYDMGGNVAEWVNDWFGSKELASERNPVGPIDGEYKIVRGGSWSDKASKMASSERDKMPPLTQTQKIGFRVVYSKGFSKDR